jgi:hypothetical protein
MSLLLLLALHCIVLLLLLVLLVFWFWEYHFVINYLFTVRIIHELGNYWLVVFCVLNHHYFFVLTSYSPGLTDGFENYFFNII